MLLSQPEGSRAFLTLQSEFLVASCWDDCIAGKAPTVQRAFCANMSFSHCGPFLFLYLP
jgi:hypothetical protein